ncbi:MAG: exodeoxyribonuclease VII small subunit [Muribaculaceae bacterium]|nr:exodeoxyribonuclease VII small subunit [Muribaculaceae bacterium]MDE5972498.1 exodeoxyribonuclease VII small subunit [Muribaculaceae bacterium]MDE6461733.1 exodeoxyribonuclease VII small subunit [Muribaculaceae bacterium]
MTDVKDLTYSQAVGELEGILRKMQSDDCDIDSLAAMTRRAAELLAECRSRLTATDEELRAILATVNPQQQQ